MKISRIKFVCYFLLFAYAFLLVSTQLLEQAPESLLGSASPLAWKSILATTLFPIKIILIYPLLPIIKFLQQDSDTPPPFFIAGFTCYWTLLALLLHYLLRKKTPKK